MGTEESNSVENAHERAKSDDRKWVGVRLTKVMMAQIEEVVETHPEWAWSNANDFVRDSVRRHLEYVRQQDTLSANKIQTLPSKIMELTRSMLDSQTFDEFRRKILELLSTIDLDREPKLFLDAATDIMKSYLGESLAVNVMKKLYEDIK
ncbi:MAG: hypothetical protein QCI38_00405 [Candidatus Thermoplasmatota archaeon]|nr:hypothetical protein [Candidatus Thermoplasmatota archaeon]